MELLSVDKRVIKLFGLHRKPSWQMTESEKEIRLWNRRNKLMKKLPKIAYEFEKLKMELEYIDSVLKKSKTNQVGDSV